MAMRVLTRQVANHLSTHLIPAVGSTTQLHTVSAGLDSLVRNAPHDADNQHTATPAESQHNQSRTAQCKLPPAVAHETNAIYGWPRPGHTLAGSSHGHQSDQQRQVTTDQHPGRGTSREQQPRRGDTDTQGRHVGSNARSQRRQPPSNRSDMQSQGPGAPQRGSSNFRGQPDRGSRPAFIDRSGTADGFRGQPDRGLRPAFIDRSGTADSNRGQPDKGLRPAFIDRSGAADGNRMPNQRPRQQTWQANRPGPQSQQSRPAPGNARMPLPEAAPDPDDPDQQAYSESRRRSRVRKATPSSTRTERPAPGSNLRGGGPAKGSQFFNPAVLGDDIESASGPNDQEDTVAENFLERQQYNPRGVPASWKDFIQDVEDQEDLDEAREISAHNRRMRSGEVRDLESDLKDNLHTMEMNSDARLEFGLETPLLQETDVPDAAHLLESAKDQICSLLEIENDEEWKEVTEGLSEDFSDLDQQLHQGLIKPQVREWTLENFVEQSMPTTHPMYPTVSRSLHMLQNNPNWAHPKKLQYMRRLIKDLS